MLCGAEVYASERVRSQYMHSLLRLTRIFLLLRRGLVAEGHSLCDVSEQGILHFASVSNNEFHANHVKVHFLVLKMIALIARGKVSSVHCAIVTTAISNTTITTAPLQMDHLTPPSPYFLFKATCKGYDDMYSPSLIFIREIGIRVLIPLISDLAAEHNFFSDFISDSN